MKKGFATRGHVYALLFGDKLRRAGSRLFWKQHRAAEKKIVDNLERDSVDSRHGKTIKFITPAIALLFVVIATAADAQTITPPQSIRQANYGPSCAHAATITMLRWQGLSPTAAWWRESYHGGETFVGLARKATVAGAEYAMLRGGDTRILEYATSTGRGAIIDWNGRKGGHHAVLFCGFDRGSVGIIDPNTNQKHTFTREAFLAHWRRCGGRSFTTLYGPPKH
jgi:hypothetical protein